MSNILETIPPIPTGKKRAWMRCNECRKVCYYDYEPHSLSTPIMTLPCGHGMSASWSEAVTYINADTAIIELSGGANPPAAKPGKTGV